MIDMTGPGPGAAAPGRALVARARPRRPAAIVVPVASRPRHVEPGLWPAGPEGGDGRATAGPGGAGPPAGAAATGIMIITVLR